MAVRKSVAQSGKISESDILSVMEGFQGDKLTPGEIAGELDNATDTEIFNLLNSMEDAGKVTGEGRGLTSKWVIGGTAEIPVLTSGKTLRAGTSGVDAPKPRRKRRTKAEMEAARAEAARRTAYNARVAETQDMDMSQSANMSDEVNFPELRELLTLSAPETPTKPLPRDLTVIQGESKPTATVTTLPSAASLLGEGQSLTLPAAPVVEPVKPRTVTLELHEPKNGECPGNDIPECPEWCPVNVWELAHDANTESARKYWGKRVAQYQADAQPNYETNEDVPPF